MTDSLHRHIINGQITCHSLCRQVWHIAIKTHTFVSFQIGQCFIYQAVYIHTLLVNAFHYVPYILLGIHRAYISNQHLISQVYFRYTLQFINAN